MNLRQQFFTIALLASAAPAVHALSGDQVIRNGNDVVYGPLIDSVNHRISLDLGFRNEQPVVLSFRLDAGDVGQIYDFNSVIDNLSGWGFTDAYLTLEGGARFLSQGNVTPTFGTVGPISWNLEATRAHIRFIQPEPNAFILGNPYDQAGLFDWTMAFPGLAAGDTVSLSIATAVPEPEAYALMLAGLGAVFAARRRRSLNERQARRT